MDDCTKVNHVYMQYLQDVTQELVQPRIFAEQKEYSEMQKQCEEWAKLKFTCQRLLSDAPRVVEGKTALEEKVFMNIEVRDTKHVIVKLADDVLLELPLQEAIKVCDRKTDMLKNMMTKCQGTVTRLKSDLTMMLASMNMSVVESSEQGPSDGFPSRTKM